MSDPLPLRACSITSSVSSIYFTITRVPVASYVPVYWSCCFIGVNLYKIFQLLSERQAIKLTDQDEDVYCRHFMKSGMRPKQFKRLLDHSSRRVFASGAILASEGNCAPSTVKLLVRGKVNIIKRNEVVFTVDARKPICFLGDTHLLEIADRRAGAKPEECIPAFSATAVAEANPGENDILAIEWNNDYLLKVLAEKSETSTTLRSVLTNSVVQKLVDVGSQNAVDKYTTLLYAFAFDDVINGLEKKVLRDYADAHGIDEDTHRQCLAKIGWSEDDFKQGLKLRPGKEISSHSVWEKLRGKIKKRVSWEPDGVLDLPSRDAAESRGKS